MSHRNHCSAQQMFKSVVYFSANFFHEIKPNVLKIYKEIRDEKAQSFCALTRLLRHKIFTLNWIIERKCPE